MKVTKVTIVVAFIIGIILFVAGMSTWSSFLNAVLPAGNGITYIDTSLNTSFLNSLVFCVALLLIPFAAVLVWKFAPIFSDQRKFFTVCIIVLSMVVSVFIRREVIKPQIRKMESSTMSDYSDPANPVQENFMGGFPVNDLKFEYFLLVGLVAGSAISLFVLKEKERSVV